MSWTISVPRWTTVSGTAVNVSLSQLESDTVVTRDGSTEARTILKNSSNTNPLVISEIITNISSGNLYTGKLAQKWQTTFRFPTNSRTQIHSQHNATIVAHNEDATCCAEDSYGPISAALTINIPDVPVITNEIITQVVTDLLQQFRTASGWDWLSVAQGSARANLG